MVLQNTITSIWKW